ncbi:exodeoxyribonuclease III [Flavobacteriaceae bacterium]|jgi:exodeoxyribonuclease-3|nr:exodeoxyribonuclease III [Flavobacteriaceae bacterium]MBT4297507.1 exodeoxyribonuclease III [Flavobacteriaceae bacterium]MDA8807871.1 exodeoxyribonuclease III [Flavobacteriaceae bacterium]MDA9176988.1 exodeoxyribonuclease III [Flavobacteriaceae bacterium]MDB0023236.1 exodeoxyribonuclease III [Flavobacteriaceae bacterium]|tara:strand:+ start:422 stop:1186 length:765 start_codon:yes stop_codon:yes gene_type:complete
MKIISYNVNGIRAAIKKGFIEWLKNSNTDVICLQEIKANTDQLDLSLFKEIGYNYNYWFSAQKKGYSGVAILSKHKPAHIEYGTGIEHMDFEGRNLRIDFEKFSVMSLYLPSGTNIARLEYKLQYMKEFMAYIVKLKEDIPNLVICGDYNICHEAIDIHDPIRNSKVSGFLPWEREWLSDFLDLGFTDSFRKLNKDPDKYSWWSYRANSRLNNKGWRIDYNLVSNAISAKIKSSTILDKIVHSDHCPIVVELNL